MANLKINRGTTYTIAFTFLRNGEAESLVGSTVRFTAKSEEYDTDTDDTTAVISKDVTNGTAQGTCTIEIEPADTATLTPGTYFYDIKVETSDGAIYKCDEGKIKLDGSPTNRLA